LIWHASRHEIPGSAESKFTLKSSPFQWCGLFIESAAHLMFSERGGMI
jgi:hypothetical protein